MNEEKEKKEENMILTVLNEALDELQKANKSLKNLGERIVALEGRVKAFDEKEIRIEPPNLEPLKGQIDGFRVGMTGKVAEIDDQLNKGLVAVCTALREETAAGLAKLAEAVEAQPKPIVRRISIFPENDREGNYKTFIRCLIGGIVGAMLVGSAYVLGNEWIQRAQPRQWDKATMGITMPADTPAVIKPAPARKPGKHTRK